MLRDKEMMEDDVWSVHGSVVVGHCIAPQARR